MCILFKWNSNCVSWSHSHVLANLFHRNPVALLWTRTAFTITINIERRTYAFGVFICFDSIHMIHVGGWNLHSFFSVSVRLTNQIHVGRTHTHKKHTNYYTINGRRYKRQLMLKMMKGFKHSELDHSMGIIESRATIAFRLHRPKQNFSLSCFSVAFFRMCILFARLNFIVFLRFTSKRYRFHFIFYAWNHLVPVEFY